MNSERLCVWHFCDNLFVAVRNSQKLRDQLHFWAGFHVFWQLKTIRKVSLKNNHVKKKIDYLISIDYLFFLISFFLFILYSLKTNTSKIHFISYLFPSTVFLSLLANIPLALFWRDENYKLTKRVNEKRVVTGCVWFLFFKNCFWFSKYN